MKLAYNLNMEFVDPVSLPVISIHHFLQIAVTLRVIQGLYKGVSTVELDNLAAETAASMTTVHPDYAILAARIAVSNLHKKTQKVKIGVFIYFSRFSQMLWIVSTVSAIRALANIHL